MEHNVFDRPVQVLAGLGIPREITSAFQAYTFLADLPGQRSCPEYLIAKKVCLAALSGSGDQRRARQAFVDFADKAGILAPEVDAVLASRETAAQPAAA